MRLSACLHTGKHINQLVKVGVGRGSCKHNAEIECAHGPDSPGTCSPPNAGTLDERKRRLSGSSKDLDLD